MGKKLKTKIISKETDKILIHNSEGKILIFKEITERPVRLQVPTWKRVYDDGTIDIAIQPYLEGMIEENNLEKIDQAVLSQERMFCVNGKLQKCIHENKQHYYSYYHDLSKEEIKRMVKYAYDHNLEFHFLTASEIRIYYEAMHNATLEQVDHALPAYQLNKLNAMTEAAEKLEKRLVYKKIEKREKDVR